MTHYDALLSAICDSEGESRFDAMLVLADYLEEEGDPRCEAWRWIAENKKVPRSSGWYGNTATIIDAAARIGHLFHRLPPEARRIGWRGGTRLDYEQLVEAFIDTKTERSGVTQ